MRVEERYCETAFSREQMEELQSMLRLKSHDEALIAAAVITGQLMFCQQLIEGREKVPSTKAAKRRLNRIAVGTKELARLLAEEPAAEDLIRRPGSLVSRLDENGEIDLSALREADKEHLKELISTLLVISKNAELHAIDDSTFRVSRRLHPASNTSTEIITRTLWPTLFTVWELAGEQLTWTENGPTHRFVNLVHSAVDLEAPSASTLRDAIRVWKKTERPAGFEEKLAAPGEGQPWRRFAGRPPWRSEGKD
jgi:hypothetical protein